MSKLKIVATLVVKPEFTGEVLKALHTVTDATRKEEGNISYVLNEDVKNKSRFIILEEWKSQEAFEFHGQTSHYIAFKEAVQGKAESLDIDVVREIY